MVTFALIAVGILAAVVSGLALICFVVGWLVVTLAERRDVRLAAADRRVDEHAEQAAAITRPKPLPRRKAPTAERLRGNAELAAVEAELDDTYRRLEDLYLR